jgi:putative lipoprotein
MAEDQVRDQQKEIRMLRVAVSILVLAGWAAAMPAAHSPGADPAVAEQRIALEGRQAPVPFEFAVDRFRITGGVTYVLRCTIVSGTRAIWTAEDVKIDTTVETVDAGAITLTPVKGG